MTNFLTSSPVWRSFSVCFFSITALVAGISGAYAQGALTPPPGSPAPTMKSLDQVFSAVQSLNAAPYSAPLGGGLNGFFNPVSRTLPLGPSPSLAGLDGTYAPALYLRANGQDIQGNHPQSSLGRENAILVLGFGQTGWVPTNGGVSTGPRTYEPLTILKPLDRSTPLLMQAMAQNQNVEGQIRFFRENPTGDGTTEHYFSIEFEDARIVRVEQGYIAYEAIMIAAPSLTWTYINGGITFSDVWGGSR